MNTMIIDGSWFGTGDGATDVDFIREHEMLTPRGPKHRPISSADILTKFREKANTLGLRLVNEQGALLKKSEHEDKANGDIVTKGGDRFMYLAEVENLNKPDYHMSVGFRNFGDKTLSFSGMCATHIMVCKNGCCTGIVKPSKMRHTIGNVNDNLIDSKIDNIFARFLEDAPKVEQQIEIMKGTKLSDEIVGKFIRSAIGSWKKDKNGVDVFRPNPYIGSKNITRILEDLENPAFNDHDDNSVFRLHNACTKVTTHNFHNPNQSVMASRYLNNLILGLINPEFVPLGDDVVDIEEVAN